MTPLIEIKCLHDLNENLSLIEIMYLHDLNENQSSIEDI